MAKVGNYLKPLDVSLTPWDNWEEDSEGREKWEIFIYVQRAQMVLGKLHTFANVCTRELRIQLGC